MNYAHLGLLPAGYRLRAAQVSDLEGVTALLIAVQVALRGESELNQEEMHSFWQRPGFSLKTDAWVVEGPKKGGSRQRNRRATPIRKDRNESG